MLVFTFLSFVHAGNELTPSTVFTTILYLRIIQTPTHQLPAAFSYLLQVWFSIKRIEKFLTADEIDFTHMIKG